jgi:hypothetical protein
VPHSGEVRRARLYHYASPLFCGRVNVEQCRIRVHGGCVMDRGNTLTSPRAEVRDGWACEQDRRLGQTDPFSPLLEDFT